MNLEEYWSYPDTRTTWTRFKDWLHGRTYSDWVTEQRSLQEKLEKFWFEKGSPKEQAEEYIKKLSKEYREKRE